MKTISDIVKQELKTEPEFSFDRSDIERRISFPAGRYTSAGPLLAPLAAVILTVALYGLLSVIPQSGLTDMFTQRGAVPYLIVFLSAWSVMILVVKNSKVSLQQKVLSIRLLPSEEPGFILTPASAELVLGRLYQSVDDPQHFLLTRRIHTALGNLRNMGRISDVDEVLRTQAENDEGIMDSSYTILRGFIWAIPVLGFIGTVLGLSVALASFGGVLRQAGEMAELRTALQGVTGGLATAFETTLEGLVAALCIHLLMNAVRRREERFLDDCKDYCQKYIVSRLRLEPSEEREPGIEKAG